VDPFISVLVVCLTAGLAFLLGSLLVVARLPRAASDSGETTITWNGLTFKTGSVCVGLSVVSAAFALALPLATLYLNSKVDDSPIGLSVNLDNVVPGDAIAVTQSAVTTAAPPVTLTLFKSSRPQSFTLTTEHTGAVQIDAKYVWMDKNLVVHIRNGGKTVKRSIPVDGGTSAELGDLRLPPAVIPAMTRIRVTSADVPTVSQKLASTAGPVLPGGGQ
jgi:hypothetical protein